MDRAPGLSVRLKLTLSYAGFLMLAGALLLAAVWVFLLRYAPDRALLVSAAFQLDSVGERSVRGRACGVGDASQGSEHAAGEKPPSQQTEHQQERQHFGGPRSESAQEVVAAGTWKAEARVAVLCWYVGYVSQEEHPHGG